MLALLTNRTFLEVAGVLLLVLGFTLYERHAGAASCAAADVAAVAAQETHNAVIAATQTASIISEGQAHAIAISMPPLPSDPLRCVRLNAPTGAVRTAQTPEPRGDGAGNGPGATDPGAQPAFDPSEAVKKIGAAADAQITELQNYVTAVCKPSP